MGKRKQSILVTFYDRKAGTDPTLICVSKTGDMQTLMREVESICHCVQEKINAGAFPFDGFMDTADGKSDYAIRQFTDAGYLVTWTFPFEIET